MKNILLCSLCCVIMISLLCPASASAWSLFDQKPGYTFELLGEKYTVPFDISELLNNGWVSKYGDCNVEANNECYLYLIYSETVEPAEDEEEPAFEVHTEAAGYVLSVILQNTSSSDASYTDCKVISAVGNLNPEGVFVYEKLNPCNTLEDAVSMYGEPTTQTESNLTYISDGRVVRNAYDPEQYVIISYSAKHDGDLTVTIHNDGK